MEECLPYKQKVGGSIPSCLSDIIISVTKKWPKMGDTKLGIKEDTTHGANDESKHGIDMVAK